MKLFNLFCRDFPRLTQLIQSEKIRMLPPIAGAIAFSTGILAMSHYLSEKYPQAEPNDWEKNIDGAMRLRSVTTSVKDLHKPPNHHHK